MWHGMGQCGKKNFWQFLEAPSPRSSWVAYLLSSPEDPKPTGKHVRKLGKCGSNFALALP